MAHNVGMLACQWGCLGWWMLVHRNLNAELCLHTHGLLLRALLCGYSEAVFIHTLPRCARQYLLPSVPSITTCPSCCKLLCWPRSLLLPLPLPCIFVQVPAQTFPLRLGMMADPGQTLNTTVMLDRLIKEKTDLVALIGDFSYGKRRNSCSSG